jgi:hypothetical protein
MYIIASCLSVCAVTSFGDRTFFDTIDPHIVVVRATRSESQNMSLYSIFFIDVYI